MDNMKEKIDDMEELDSEMDDIEETEETDREYDIVKINSTMLATGWFSAYKKDDSNDEENLDYYPLVAWANVRIRYKDDNSETDKVMGMDAADDRSVDFCELDEGFVKYVNERYLEKENKV